MFVIVVLVSPYSLSHKSFRPITVASYRINYAIHGPSSLWCGDVCCVLMSLYRGVRGVYAVCV